MEFEDDYHQAMTKLPANPKRLFRLKEAAIYLSLSSWKLRHLIQSAQLPVIQPGPNAPWLLDVRDLDSWVDRNKQVIE